MSGGKNRVKKSLIFGLRGTSRKIAKNCFQTSCLFGILSCQNAANTSAFRRFALRAGSNKSEVYDTF